MVRRRGDDHLDERRAGCDSASLLSSQTTTSFDDLGRAYRTEVFSVNPSTVSVGSYSLKSDTWFDAGGW